MLALTRRVGEEIVVGDVDNPLGIIRIIDIRSDKVRLSFDFPREILINRKELAEQKARQSEQYKAPYQQTPPQTPPYSSG
jgi:carbon storage regulator CsrA